MFIPINCTNELQLVDVIIQRPLKHVFKVNFNKWTTNIIKNQICEVGEGVAHYLKMSNLRPQIYEWLHVAWTQVQGMHKMIIKSWQKIGITNAFTSKFQVAMMEANALTPLFTFIL